MSTHEIAVLCDVSTLCTNLVHSRLHLEYAPNALLITKKLKIKKKTQEKRRENV